MIELFDAIESITNQRPINISPLPGGCVGEGYLVEMGGDDLVAKVSKTGEGGLAVEAQMLSYLSSHSALPVPHVLHGDEHLLLMTYVENDGDLDASAQVHAAGLLAKLHDITSLQGFGFDYTTPIGGLPQDNAWAPSWLAFFRDQRLLPMGRAALSAGQMPSTLYDRLERLAAKLDRWIIEPSQPSLIHGDLWGGNILSQSGKITGFVDPALYFAHPEIELAFSTLFNTFDASFFDAYQQFRPIEPDFFERRRELYNLYPLLVHVRLFGGSYTAAVDQSLHKFGV